MNKKSRVSNHHMVTRVFAKNTNTLMKTLPLFLAISLLIGLISGCTKDADDPTENIYVNERFPDSAEKFHPDSMRVFTFESYFKNWVTVSKQDQILAEGYIETYSNGWAGRFLVKAQSRDRITIRVAKEQASFRLKNGYKYLYINKLNTNKWTVTYSNYGRVYL